jgi:ribosomal protein S12 methylthiotransferase
MYLWPAGINKRLIETVAASKKVVHYLDIPLQHVNDRILQSMKRPDTKEHLHKLIDGLRSAMPDIILRTTLIVGFPGETEREFEELLEFVKTVRFDALGCFAYSREAGTSAAELPEQISESIKTERLRELMLTQQEIAFAKNAVRVGTTLDCLVDCANTNGGMTGRFYGQARDIDSVCLMRNCSAEPGQFVKTQVVGSDQYDLIVEQTRLPDSSRRIAELEPDGQV